MQTKDEAVSKPVFRFAMKATPRDPSRYYHPRWDGAFTMTVLGENRSEAVQKGADMLGKNERGWPWAFQIDRIDEVGCGCGGQGAGETVSDK